MKRIFDFTASFVGLLFLSPLLLFISLYIVIESGFPVFYLQERMGKNRKPFTLFKFRTMYKDAHLKGLLTVGGRDPRITRAGYFLRKYKLDELPQLLNVLIGNMSLVGPRPEVKKYVDLYNAQQMKVLDYLPGITDPASIAFKNENELLAKQAQPEQYYIEVVMPEKIKLNLSYQAKANLISDIDIIFKTIFG
jgi:lipopolysaccharide/colanic/teichoic acid biosynthesis glycosyltransferase